MSALGDAKFSMMMGMLRNAYTPADAAEFAVWVTAKKPEDVAFIRQALRDLSGALDDANGDGPPVPPFPDTKI